jgi:hypothetical protein
MADVSDIKRSHRFGLHVQLETMLLSLQTVVTAGSPISDVSRDAIRKLRNDSLLLVTGPVVAEIPAVTEDSTAADLLAIVSLLAGTSRSFLTSKEIETFADQAAGWIGKVVAAKSAFGG